MINEIYIPIIQYVINNTFHAVIKISLVKIIFGCDQYNHADAKLIEFLRDIAKSNFNFEKERKCIKDIALESTKS